MHMGRNMCETTAPSRVKNYSRSCVQPDFLYTTCYMLCCQDWFFSLHRKGKLIAKRDENLFSYWLGGAECQDGGGQLWGKAGRPTAFCLSRASLHRVCDKTSLQEYWANTESLSLGCALFPECATAKKLHTSNIAFIFPPFFSLLNWIVAFCCQR